MGRQKLLLTSSVHGFSAHWPPAKLSKEDLAWARKNLVKGADGKCAFERRRGFRRYHSVKRVAVLFPEDISDRVYFKAGEVHPRVLVRLGKRYNFRAKFELALRERDADLAPHVMFRKLSPGIDAVALDFIREFGPLFLDDMTREPVVWIDLNDFWKRHARFVAIVRLYESINDCEQLRNTLISIAENIQSLDEAGPARIGMIPDTGKDTPFIRYVSLNRPEDFRRVDEEGDLTWNHQCLQLHARELICAELILQTHDGIRSGWEENREEEGVGFRPTRIITSLWAGLWEMFGLDTWRGYSWKACRICSRYFYPMQANSECCTPQHQALWSKREYARKRRAAEKEKAAKKRT